MSLQVLSISDKTGFSIADTGVAREATQTFWVELNTTFPRNQAVDALKQLKQLPKEYDIASWDKFLIALPVRYQQHDELPQLWIVTVTWRGITDIADTIKDPVDIPALIETGTYYEQDNPDTDFEGKPLCNTAGELINWPYQRGYPMYTVRKNYGEYPKQFATQRDFVNNDQVEIYGVKYEPYTLFCPDVQISSIQWKNSFPFFAMQCSIYVNDKRDSRDRVLGWRKLKRNTGYHERKFKGFRRTTDDRLTPKIYETLADAKKDGFLLDSLTPVYEFIAIQLDTATGKAYPSSPVLLTPFGTAYREKLPVVPGGGAPADMQAAIDQVDATIVDPLQKKYLKRQILLGNYPGGGKVMGTKLQGEPAKTSGITEQQWEEAVVEARLYNLVSFKKTFPLEAQDIPKGFRP